MRMAASSPVWFTRRAEERNFCCSRVRGRIGLPSFCRCNAGCSDCEDGGWGADMVLEKRDVWREAHAVLGARKSRTGYWMLRCMPRGIDRGESNGDGISCRSIVQ
jgi:hypothetical protein